MKNKVVLITGALTGIGRAAALAFARKGAQIVVSGRRDEAGEALANELRSLGSEAEYIRADVRKEDDIRDLVAKTVARFGHLDIAVNNAATEGEVGPITEQTAKSFAATFDTNVLGVLLSMSMRCWPCRARAAAASSISPQHMAIRVRRLHPYTLQRSMPWRGSPSRWHSKLRSPASE
jgi:NAD(P)-dependent dehydrogenase (short-subunit alcohol dehydrogenase family)